MTTSSTPENEQTGEWAPETNESAQQATSTKDLISDPDYIQLLEHYQQAEFTACRALLGQLEERYPENPVLLEFKDELEMKLSVRALTSSIKKGEKRLTRKATINLSIFAIVGTLVALIAFFLALIYFIGDIDLPELPAAQQDTAQLNSFYQQAEQLLELGQPQPAEELVEKIREIDPDFPDLADLIARTEQLLQLETQYQAALTLVAEDKPVEALEKFKAIEAEKPGLWDVGEQITAIETGKTIAQLITEGNAAFQVKNWSQVISAYEQVLKVDPNTDRPLVDEQLFISYLNQTINLLDNEGATAADIQTAEANYRKATELFPQSTSPSPEGANLQQVSRNLLLAKYTQIASQNLGDQNQNLSSINQAVSNLEKAVNLVPNDGTALQEFQNAQSYQIGFQNFVDQDWEGAISNFEQINATDPNFADGNAATLLVEAYYTRAKQLTADSAYTEALVDLEKAEFLVWGKADKQINLIQIQVLIGDTLGQMEAYESAVSYYQYALNAVQAPVKFQNNPAIANQWTSALNLAASKNFEAAFPAFQDLLTNIDVIYSKSDIDVDDGVSLALFANANLSTLELVINANDLPGEMVTTQAMTLQVPTIEN